MAKKRKTISLNEEERAKQNELNQQTLAKNKKLRRSVTARCITELQNPETVCLLGGSPTYVHSHTKTWTQGLKTSNLLITKMLHELVQEQKAKMANVIGLIELNWHTIYNEITKQEQRLGSDIVINNWESFSNYYLSFPRGNGTTLSEILRYKGAQSALSALNLKYYSNETQEEYLKRLVRIKAITKEQKDAIEAKNLTVYSETKELKKELEQLLEASRQQFIKTGVVTEWIKSHKKDTKIKQSFGDPIQKQIDLKPDAKQLGGIVEYAFKDDPHLFAKVILDNFEHNIHNIFAAGSGSSKGSASLSSIHIAGEKTKQAGGLSNKLNKSDLVEVIDFGTVSIQIPTSVKLSANVEAINTGTSGRVVWASDMFSASAEASSLDFDSINQSVNSQVYKKHRDKMLQLFNYVYTNAAVIPSESIVYYKYFNNKVMYYLAWLKLVNEIVGSPNGNSHQYAMMVESVNAIYNTADLLRKVQAIQPAEIGNYIYENTRPDSNISYANPGSVAQLRAEKDNVIANMWQDFLHEEGPQITYPNIYTKVTSTLKNYSTITQNKLPSISLTYRIKLGNARAFT